MNCQPKDSTMQLYQRKKADLHADHHHRPHGCATHVLGYLARSLAERDVMRLLEKARQYLHMGIGSYQGAIDKVNAWPMLGNYMPKLWLAMQAQGSSKTGHPRRR